MKRNSEPRPDFHVIAIDETEFWTLDGWFSQADIDNLARIETVYVYDKNVHTYMCEMVPSYYLIPVETRTVFEDNYEPTPDLDQELYAYAENEATYVHVPTIDIMFRKLKDVPFSAKRLGSLGLRRCSIEQEWDVAQSLRENAVI